MPRFQWQPTFRVPSETCDPGIFAHCKANDGLQRDRRSLSCRQLSVMVTRNMARTARESLRSTRFPCPVPGSLIPIKCSLHIAVFEVPSVIDSVPTAP